jgi:Fur family ferric uptake transcriptional regulator
MMESFVSKGIITQIDFQDGKYRYEIMRDHHHHLVCTQCGSVQAIHDQCLAIDTKAIEGHYEFTVQRHQLEYFGLCSKCK